MGHSFVLGNVLSRTQPVCSAGRRLALGSACQIAMHSTLHGRGMLVHMALQHLFK